MLQVYLGTRKFSIQHTYQRNTNFKRTMLGGTPGNFGQDKRALIHKEISKKTVREIAASNLIFALSGLFRAAPRALQV
jgi:hypothetical protein